MKFRLCSIALVALALVAYASRAAVAADDSHEGKVVRAGSGELVMTDLEGKNQHTMKVGTEVKITLDGKDAQLEDLKSGFRIKVTTRGEGAKAVVTAIDAKS